MPTLTYPGVYIEELPSSTHTITGVATSIGAFVGWAPKGDTTQATLIQSPSDYQTQFGGLDTRSYLGYSVLQFFQNGGQQAYIVRLISSDTSGTAAYGTANLTAGTSKLAVQSISKGSWANSYGIQLSAGSAAGTFNLSVVYAPAGSSPAVLETYTGLTDTTWANITSLYVSVKATGTATGAIPTAGLTMLMNGADKNAAVLASLTVSGVIFQAQNEGAWGNGLAIAAVAQPGDATNTRFSLYVLTVNSSGGWSLAESYNNLCVVSTDPMYFVTVINADSNFIQVSSSSTIPSTSIVTADAAAASNSLSPTMVPLMLTGGVDGTVLNPTDSAFINALNLDLTGTGGIDYLTRVDIFNLLCVPGETDAPTIQSLQEFCNAYRAFYIVDCAQSATTSGLIQSGPVGSTAGSITGQYSINSAFYFPWVNAPDPLAGNRSRLFPPCGFVAGLYAATDASRGVWKAPAGIDASLTQESGLQYNLTDIENGSLNPQAVNCLRHFKTYGDIVWGARTLQGSDQAGSQWKYVPIRRLALFIESSLYEGTQWVVFEPNDETLWGQIRLNVGAFMQGLFLQGAFQGTTPQQAYIVKCDAENNPQPSINQGIVNILVGFMPLYPAEFVVIQIQQMTGQSAT